MSGPPSDGGADSGSDTQAMSPVLGTVLMVAVTIMLASVVSAGVLTMGDQLEEPNITPPPATASGNPWVGSLGDLVALSDNTAGAEDVRYRVNFVVAKGSDTDGNSLNSVELRMEDSSLAMFSDTSQSSLAEAKVDTDDDGDYETNISDDLNGWTDSDGGATVKIEFGGVYTADVDDSIVIVFDGVDNPDAAGTYDLEVQTSGDGNWQSGSITIVSE